MATFTKNDFSGATDGIPILISATASTGTTIHTAVSGTTAGTWDELWIYAQNNNSTDEVVTIEFGGTAGKNNIIDTIGTEDGLILMVPGLILQNGAIVTAFAETSNFVSISGFVNSITA